MNRPVHASGALVEEVADQPGDVLFPVLQGGDGDGKDIETVNQRRCDTGCLHDCT